MNTEEKCSNCNENSHACVPFFLHENAMMHYNKANHRMLIALIVSVVVMMIGNVLIGYMFLSSYNSREKGWQEIIQQITGVDDGLHQQPGHGDH